MILLAFVLLVEGYLGFPAAGVIASTIWLAILLLGWGFVLGALLERDAGIEVAAPATGGLTRREFVVLLASGVAAVVAAVIGVGVALSGRGTETAQAGPTPAGSTPTPAGPTPGPENTSGPAAFPPGKRAGPTPVAGARHPLRDHTQPRNSTVSTSTRCPRGWRRTPGSWNSRDWSISR